VPCRALVYAEPLTVRVDHLVADITEQIKDVYYRAAVAVDGARRPIELVTRSDRVDAQPRRVLLLDHAEHAQSMPGVEQAEIVEVLDHHHVGSIETKVPVAATFDPVGSSARSRIGRRGRPARGYEPQEAEANAAEQQGDAHDDCEGGDALGEVRRVERG
jgi:manganese-dependent inorganic pyrophosphatase